MLSRTADHLFWMARYMERAENTARMLNVNYETSLLPQSAEATEQGWRGLLSISELTPAYLQRYGEIDGRTVYAYAQDRAVLGAPGLSFGGPMSGPVLPAYMHISVADAAALLEGLGEPGAIHVRAQDDDRLRARRRHLGERPGGQVAEIQADFPGDSAKFDPH